MYKKTKNTNSKMFYLQKFYFSKYKNLGIAPSENQRIPAILHKIWLTNQDDPKNIPQGHVDNLLDTIDLFSKDQVNKWSYIVWINSVHSLGVVKELLESHGVEFRDVNSLDLPKKSKDNIDYLIENELWGMASDALRYIVVNKLGGFYSDLGAEHFRAPEIDLYRYDFFVNQWDKSMVANNFFASKPGHPILLKTVDFVKENLFILRNGSINFKGVSIKDLTTQMTAEPFNIGFSVHSYNKYYYNNVNNTIDVVIPHSQYYNNQHLLFDGIDPSSQDEESDEWFDEICAADSIYLGQDAAKGESWYNKEDGIFQEREYLNTSLRKIVFLRVAEFVKDLKDDQFVKQSNNHHNIQKDCSSDVKTPHIIHYIWVTDPNSPKEIDLKDFQQIKRSMFKFKEDTSLADWQYKFHTNAKESIPTTVKFFESLGFKNENLNIDNFVTGSLINDFVAHKQFGLAADLARYEILNQEGGIYYDLNFNVKRALDHEICRYSYLGLQIVSKGNNILLPENYFFMSEPSHPVLVETIKNFAKAFFGEDRDLYKSALELQNRELTDLFFNKFSFNSVKNLTSEEGRAGIIYRFLNPNALEYEDFDNLSNDEKTLSRNQKAYYEFYKTIESYYEVNKTIESYSAKVKLAITDSNVIEPIGYDGVSDIFAWDSF
jgi:mannosyltransferase OCH1-like enzyme